MNKIEVMASIHIFVGASILLVAVCKRSVSSEISSLTIEPRSPICLKKGENIPITIMLHSNLSSVNFTRTFSNLSLLWYRNGIQLPNATIIHYTNNSIVSRFVAKYPGLFTCVLIGPTASQNLANRSVSVGMRPNPVANLVATPKFISDEDTFRYVVVSWLRQSIEYVYRVFFKIDLLGCFSFPCVEDNIEPTCIATKCTARIDTEGHDLSDLAFYIVTRQGACESRSRVWNFNLTLSSCDVLPPKTLFYVPYPPTKLTIETSYRSVILRWQDIVSWSLPSVSLTYTCSKSSYTIKSKKVDIRVIFLSDKHIRGYAPYGKCTFCLSIQEYHCGQFSEKLCKTTRLREEPPSEAPNITCTTDTCPTSYDDQFRNLTVTWELPAEKYWGGVLREIKLRYTAAESNSTWQEIVLTNLSSKSVAIIGLNKTLHYSVYLQACNTEGCSGNSKQLQIYGIRARPLYSIYSSSNYNTVWYSIGGAMGFIIVMVVCIIMIPKLFFKQRTELEPLSETDIPNYDEADDKIVYDHIDDEQCEQLYDEGDPRGDETPPVNGQS
ncbi:netrin receptor DCC-like [Paramuricea clavata]|uniref:Netrin receptor DCC-like n=1 Tax=Paramuricea clavata TaxID=317549 RepID=A0A7D9HUC6_PARCT|nr:netrin receptor DCC-like [Paramuricea clavata]